MGRKIIKYNDGHKKGELAVNERLKISPACIDMPSRATINILLLTVSRNIRPWSMMDVARMTKHRARKGDAIR